MKLLQLCVGMVRTNCYIVYDEATREAAVIDPGDNAKSILHAVNEEQLNVKYVLLTHAHFDHILAAHEVLEATGAQYVVPEKDTWLLSRDNMGQFRGLARNYVQDTPDILANEGTEVTFGGMTATYMATPGHTPGSSVIRIGDCLFTGDTLWFGADGGYSFISALAEDNKLAVKSLALLEKKLKKRGLHPLFITGHTGWTDNIEFAFAHKNELCSPFKKRAHDPNALYDAYDESDDTEEKAKIGYLKGVGR